MISIDGLVTGLDTSKIISDLVEIQRQPLKIVQAQAARAAAKQTAYGEIIAKLLGLQTVAAKLGSSDLFSSVEVASSDESVLAVRAAAGASPGSYVFRAARLARASQFASNGFATRDGAGLGAGTLSIEIGAGHLERTTALDDLNGGSGVQRGKILIADRAGASAAIDLSAAITVDDVIDAINAANGISVTARLAAAGDARPGTSIVIADSSGGSGALSVADIGSGRTARDLGIRGSAAAAELQGAAIAGIAESTRLSLLNDGNGVVLRAGVDLAIAQKNGEAFSVDLAGATTIGDVLDAINNHAENDGVTVAIAPDGNRLLVTDASAAAGTTTIADAAGGRAARDLGIAGSFVAASAPGNRIVAGIDTVLLRELRGGAGVAAGSIHIADRAGASATIDLSSAETVRDVIDAINAAGIGVEARINDAGDGLALEDSSGGSNALVVAEVGGGTTAADLGILASVEANDLDGEDVKHRYVSETTRLATIDAGRGVHAGSIRIADRNGISFRVNLGQEETIGDVLTDINGAASAAGSDLVASINGDGNGIVLSAASGSGTLRVDEVDGGTTAADLGIAGSAPAATPGTLDGSFERSIAIDDSMTLEDLKDAIDRFRLPVSVAIVDDGSSEAPYRLLVSGTESGESGRVIVHARDTDLAFEATAEAQDAVMMVGGSDGARPLIVRSSGNTFEEIVPGLTLTALRESAAPVRVTATARSDAIVETIESFVEKYNDVVDSIRELTAFNVETQEAALLLGDSTLRSVLNQLSLQVTRPVTGNPADLNLALHVGLRIGTNGRLLFDRTELERCLATDRAQVASLFGAERQLDLTTALRDFRNGEGVRRVAGQADFRIDARDGSSFSVDLGNATTVRDVLAAIDGATGNGSVTASIAAGGRSIVLVDASTGSGTFRVTSVNGSAAYNDLGLNRSADQPGGATITGSPIDLAGDWGLGRRLVDALERMANADTGAVQLRSETVAKQIEDLEKRAASIEERIGRQEELLRRKFAQLEVIMGEQQNTLQRLTAIMGTLSGRKS